MFMSGFVIPGLAPTTNGGNGSQPEWGEIGSLVRGWCYYYNSDRGFGYMRFLKRIAAGLWITDSRSKEDSPYETAFFHFSNLQEQGLQNQLPNHDLIFEFRLAESNRPAGGLTAETIKLISRL